MEYLAQVLAQRPGALLLVTHDRDLIERVGGEILELHGGRIERYPRGYSRYRREREARRAQVRKAWELQRAEIARQEEFIRRNIAGQNTRQAQARQKLLDKLQRLQRLSPTCRCGCAGPTLLRSGDRAMDVEELTVGWRPLLRGVSFVLRRGERLAVVGRNGAGKTTLLHTLAGRLRRWPGRSGSVPAWCGLVRPGERRGAGRVECLAGAARGTA